MIEKEIISFLQNKPGYIKKSPIQVLNKISKNWNLKDLELTKKIQRKLRLKAKGFDDIDIQNLLNPKKLFIDIEVTPDIVYSWGIGHKVNLSHESIIQERQVICVAYKWEGENKIYCVEWDNGDDRELLKKVSSLIYQADDIIGHNVQEFDIKFLRGRCLYHGIPFPQKLNIIDTYKESKNLFRLNSMRLDYLGKFLFSQGKTKTDFQMWKDITENNSKYTESLNKMVKYCKDDVSLLVEVYNKIKGYLPEKKFRWIKTKD